MALPIMLVLFALCLNGLAAVAARVQLIDQSQVAARMLGRGESEQAVTKRLGLPQLSVGRTDQLVCVTLERQVAIFTMSARGCALDDAHEVALGEPAQHAGNE